MWLRISEDVLVNTDKLTSVKVMNEFNPPRLLMNSSDGKKYIYEGNVEEALKKIMYVDGKQFFAG